MQWLSKERSWDYLLQQFQLSLWKHICSFLRSKSPNKKKVFAFLVTSTGKIWFLLQWYECKIDLKWGYSYISLTEQKVKFSIKDFFSKCDQICSVDLVVFTEEFLNGKIYFLMQWLFLSLCHTTDPWQQNF